MLNPNTQTTPKSARQNPITRFWGWLTNAHPGITEPGARRQAQLLAGLSIFVFITNAAGILATSIIGTSQAITPATLSLIMLSGFTLVVYILSRSRHYYTGAVLLTAGITVITYVYISTAGVPSFQTGVLTFVPLALIIGAGLLSTRGMVLLAMGNLVGIALMLLLLPDLNFNVWTTVFGLVMTFGILFVVVVANRTTVERDRLDQVRAANKELQTFSSQLEQRVADRTQDIILAAEVGHRMALVRSDVGSMLLDAVQLIRERFNLYYTQVYLLDESNRNLILRAGTGIVGEELLRRGHKLPVDMNSLNGTAAVERRPMIVEDTSSSQTFRPNVLLPDTHSEMAVPLVAGEHVLGVLDMQSAQPGTFSNENLPAFQILAGLLASAIMNVQLVARVQHSQEEVESQSRMLTRRGWDEFLDAIHQREYLSYSYGDRKKSDPEDTTSAHVLEAPISILGEEVGEFHFEGEREWSEDEKELVRTISRQVSQTVDNMRLLAQAERYRAEAEDALQRLTREGWDEYLAEQQNAHTSFVYVDEQVKPADQETGIEETGYVKSILVGEEMVGELGISGVENISPEDEELISLVTQALATHLESIRLFDTAQSELEERARAEQALQKRAAELQTVAQLSANLSTVPDPSQIMQNVVDLSKDAFTLYHAHIYTYDAETQTLKLAAGAGEVGRQMVAQGWEIPLEREHSLVAQAARSHTGVIVNDVRVELDYMPNPLLPNTQSEMAIPLISGHSLLGVMDIQSDKVNHFTQDDLSIQTTLAAQISAALENARLFHQIQQQADYEATINSISQRIQSTTSVESALQVAIRELGRALGARRTSVHLTPTAAEAADGQPDNPTI